jgi:hypothetical protein
MLVSQPTKDCSYVFVYQYGNFAPIRRSRCSDVVARAFGVLLLLLPVS